MKGLSCPRKGLGKSRSLGCSCCLLPEDALAALSCALYPAPASLCAKDAMCWSCAWVDHPSSPLFFFFVVPLQKSRHVRAGCARTAGGARRQMGRQRACASRGTQGWTARQVGGRSRRRGEMVTLHALASCFPALLPHWL